MDTSITVSTEGRTITRSENYMKRKIYIIMPHVGFGTCSTYISIIIYLYVILSPEEVVLAVDFVALREAFITEMGLTISTS